MDKRTLGSAQEATERLKQRGQAFMDEVSRRAEAQNAARGLQRGKNGLSERANPARKPRA